MTDLYAVLGLKRDADDRAIHRAYRSLSKRHHPDMPTGDAATFDGLRTARDVLTDPDRRRRYDETGEFSATEPDNTEAQIGAIIAQLLDQALYGPTDPEAEDILGRMQSTLREMLKQFRQRSEQLRIAKMRAMRLRARFSRSDNGPNRIVAMLEVAERNATDAGQKLDVTIEIHERALKALQPYAFQRKQPDPPAPTGLVNFPQAFQSPLDLLLGGRR